MANAHRGEIEANIGGKTYVLCMTLGALAEMEAEFGVDDIVSLAAKFENGYLSARDILRIIGCGIRGGGTPMSNDELAALPVADGLQGYVSIAANLLAATFGVPDAGDKNAFPPPPQDASI